MLPSSMQNKGIYHQNQAQCLSLSFAVVKIMTTNMKCETFVCCSSLSRVAALPARRNVAIKRSAVQLHTPQRSTRSLHVWSAAAAAQPSTSSTSASSEDMEFDLACPICQTTIWQVQASSAGACRCPRCARNFGTSSSGALDLTLTSGMQPKVYKQSFWGGTTIFRNPLVSLAYERGWRQSFAWAGFPGVDKEAEIALNYLQPAYGSTIVDMSCGSGLFARRFLSSGRFPGVIAADFSESMLQEARTYFQQDASLDPARYLLLRADVGRLPFATGSVAAIHAGAAIHCWPEPLAALAEISRVLRPGGVFVGSTFLTATAPLGQLLGSDALVRPLRGLEPTIGSYRWWEEDELKELCAAVGLMGFQRDRRDRFIMFSATKPSGDVSGQE